MAEVAAFAHPVTHCIALICSMSIDLWMGEFTRARETLPILRDCVRANTLAPYIAVAQASTVNARLRLRMSAWNDRFRQKVALQIGAT